jgi:hypothetical protein
MLEPTDLGVEAAGQYGNLNLFQLICNILI